MALSRIGGDLFGGLIAGFYTLTFSFAYGALIFSGPLTAARPLGIAIAVSGTVLLLLVTALLSSLPFALNAPDATTAALLAVFAGSIAETLGAASPEMTVATVRAGLALSSLLIGTFVLVLGLCRFGQAVRYVPYPVTAGFLAATALFLMIGGVRVGTGVAVQLSDLSALLGPSIRPRLLATVAVGVAMFVLMPKLRHPAALPCLLLVAGVGHHIAFAAVGLDHQAALASGWLSHVPDRLALFDVPWSAGVLRQVDWQALGREWGDVASAALVVTVNLMLNVSLLEAATDRDADINGELRASGLAAIASGLGGGMIGTLGVGGSLLLWRSGSRTRLGGVIAAAVVAAVGVFAPGAMELIPNPVTGGALIYFGLEGARVSVIASRGRMPLADWAMLLLIGGATVWLGRLTGLALGMLAACLAFAARAAATPVVRLQYRGNAGESLVERSDAAREVLRIAAERVLIVHLQGSLFFGTSSRLLAHLRRELQGEVAPHYLVLDLGGVTEFDSTAALAFDRLLQIAAAHQVTPMLSNIPPTLAQRLPARAAWRHFAFTAEALAWCEDRLLEQAGGAGEREPFRTRLMREFGGGLSAERLLDAMDQAEISAGALLVAQGETSGDLYFVERGHFAVEVLFPNGRMMRVRRIGPGTMIGEIGFYMGLPRTASVRAEAGAHVWRLTRAALDSLHTREPEAALRVHAMMAERLCQRILDMRDLMSALARSGPGV